MERLTQNSFGQNVFIWLTWSQRILCAQIFFSMSNNWASSSVCPAICSQYPPSLPSNIAVLPCRTEIPDLWGTSECVRNTAKQIHFLIIFFFKFLNKDVFYNSLLLGEKYIFPYFLWLKTRSMSSRLWLLSLLEIWQSTDDSKVRHPGKITGRKLE